MLQGFSPYYQKKYNQNKEVVGAEILMRSIAAPNKEAIKFLEQNGNILDLDVEALNYALKWSTANNLPCSSNISPVSLKRRCFINQIIGQDILNQITLEITEAAQLNNSTINNIEVLKQHGFKLSLDDYGSLNSGLNRFSTLPFDEIKIDRYILDCVAKDRCSLNQNSRAIAACKHTINMAHELGCKVVAEGIEEEAQFYVLAELGCDEFQGYWLHRPEAVQQS